VGVIVEPDHRPVPVDAHPLGPLIGVTSLHFGYAIGTRNLRHFQMVPNLAIIQL